MEERVAAAIRRIDAAAQVVPARDLVDRLVADDLFQDHRRRRPVDPAQHQEAAVEPRREQMHEVGIHRREVLAVVHRIKELLAHPHQHGGAARRKIETPQQLLPARLGREMDASRGLVGRSRLPGLDRGLKLVAVRPEPVRQGFEERDPRPDRQFGVFFENLAGQRHARRLAAAGQQLFAQFGQALRARRGDVPPVARAVEQRTAALGDAVEHFAEKGRVHGGVIPQGSGTIIPEMLKE
jgi:hypothetical protein